MSRETDALLQCNFYLEIDGIQIVAFKSIDGIETSYGTSMQRDGNDPDFKKKIRTISETDDLVATYFVTKESKKELTDWFESGERKSCSVVQLDSQRNETNRVNLFGCIPIKMKWFENFDAESDDPQFRTITISVESVKED